jgi:hypothetical protein
MRAAEVDDLLARKRDGVGAGRDVADMVGDRGEDAFKDRDAIVGRQVQSLGDVRGEGHLVTLHLAIDHRRHRRVGVGDADGQGARLVQFEFAALSQCVARTTHQDRADSESK